MQQSYDVIIVGGGVIGCSIAYQLSLRRVRTLLLERNLIASEASGAAAGMLGAQSEFIESESLFTLARKSRSIFPKLALELKECSGIDIGFVQYGVLRIARTEGDVKCYQRAAALQQKLGESVKWLSSAQAVLMEPALSPSITGALYFDHEGQVLAPQLTRAFAQAAAALGADIREFVEVHELMTDSGKLRGVRTDNEVYLSDQVVIASSIWSQPLLHQIGLNLPLYPVKGECIAIKTIRPLLHRTIYTDGCYLVPKSNGETVIGATVRPRTTDRKVTISGISELLQRAEELVPCIREAEWSRAWSGLRPQTPEGLPYMGEHPDMQGLYLAAGHYRNGILLSPITGIVMADLVQGKQPDLDLSAFAVPHSICKLRKNAT